MMRVIECHDPVPEAGVDRLVLVDGDGGIWLCLRSALRAAAVRGVLGGEVARVKFDGGRVGASDVRAWQYAYAHGVCIGKIAKP